MNSLELERNPARSYTSYHALTIMALEVWQANTAHTYALRQCKIRSKFFIKRKRNETTSRRDISSVIITDSDPDPPSIRQGSPDAQGSAARNPALRWLGALIPYVISASFCEYLAFIYHCTQEYYKSQCKLLNINTSSSFDVSEQPGYTYCICNRILRDWLWW